GARPPRRRAGRRGKGGHVSWFSFSRLNAEIRSFVTRACTGDDSAKIGWREISSSGNVLGNLAKKAAMAARHMTAREWGLLLALSLLWGGSFLFIGILVRELPPFTIVTARVALAAMALWVVVLVSGQPVPREWRAWLAFFGMGVLNNVIP